MANNGQNMKKDESFRVFYIKKPLRVKRLERKTTSELFFVVASADLFFHVFEKGVLCIKPSKKDIIWSWITNNPELVHREDN